VRRRGRIVNVLRLHLANRATYGWVPLLVIGGTMLISVAMYGVILLGFRDEPGPRPELYGFGGLQFIPSYYCVTVGIQAMMYTYQFAMAMSLTRREYINGTTLLAALFALALGGLFALGRALETLTGGYGIGFRYFSLAGWFGQHPWWEQWLFLTALSLMFFMAGFCCTTVFRRGGAIRLVVALTAWTMAVVGACAVVTWREWWPPVGEFVLALTPGGAGLVMLAVAVLFSAGSYWSMRKTVP
jgi:hypothetical protein